MTWYFIYYASSNYLHSFEDIESCFNKTWLANMCSDTIIHSPETHRLHEIGNRLRNNGLRTAIILQTENEHEAMVLQLMMNTVIQPQEKLPPVLQLVLCDPDFARLTQVCMPLEELRIKQAQSRDDLQVSNNIQRVSLRLVRTVEDLGTSISPEFTTAASVFVDECSAELDRIQKNGRVIAKQSANERKKILRELMLYATFVLK